MRMFVLASLAMLLMPQLTFAQSETFLQAVGFALTGTDDAKVEVVDKQNCVFRIKTQVFYLNNVHVDRLIIQNWSRKNILGEQRFVTVELHGDKTVYESTTEGLKKSDFDTEESRALYAEMKKINPNLFKSSQFKSNSKTLEIVTNENERIGRAWAYVYANGCVGRKSPF